MEVAAGAVFAWDCGATATALVEVFAAVWACGFAVAPAVEVTAVFAFSTGAFEEPPAAVTGGNLSLDFFLRNITKEKANNSGGLPAKGTSGCGLSVYGGCGFKQKGRDVSRSQK